MGHYGVVRYNDGMFYRVYISQELSSGIEVVFVDFGNSLIVSRNEIYAPVPGLREFVQPPFGIRCSSPELLLSRPELSKILVGETIQVEIGPMIMDDIYTVYLVENEAKKKILKSLQLLSSSTGKSNELLLERETFFHYSFFLLYRQ